MAYLDAHLSDIEQRRLPALHRQLIPLENGQRSLAERQIGGPWIDVTRERIEQLRGAIADLQLVVSQLRDREAL